MGKKKTTTNQTQTNTYGHVATPETPDIRALRDFKAVKDPSIPFQYGRRREFIDNSYKNPLGAATSPATRDAADRAVHQALSMDEAQANAESQYNADNQNFLRQSAIAEMTAPKFVQTGGTATGQTVQQGGFWSGLLQSAVGQAAGAGMTALG